MVKLNLGTREAKLAKSRDLWWWELRLQWVYWGFWEYRGWRASREEGKTLSLDALRMTMMGHWVSLEKVHATPDEKTVHPFFRFWIFMKASDIASACHALKH